MFCKILLVFNNSDDSEVFPAVLKMRRIERGNF